MKTIPFKKVLAKAEKSPAFRAAYKKELKKLQVKTMKAWIAHADGYMFNEIFLTRKTANMRLKHQGWKIISCTISYTVPPSKAKK